MDNDTQPAGDLAETTGSTPLSEMLAFQNPDRHEVHREAGVEPQEDPAPAPAPDPIAAAQPAPASAQPAPQAETKTEPTPAGQAGEEKQPRWYREHMAQVNRERAAEKAEIERLRSATPQPQRQASQNLPDPLEDPAAYADALRSEYRRDLEVFQLRTTLTLSERFARQQHGSEAFEECKAWLSTKPDIEAWAIQQPDPWSAAYTQYQREQLSDEIGDDPNAWREKERQRIRDEIKAELAGEQQQAQHIPATAPQMRAAPPPPASAVRSAAPRDPGGRFTGPTPIGAALKSAR